MTKRAIFYVDGFNLFHALRDLGTQHLRWLSLAQVAKRLHLAKTQQVERVVYFSAYATHHATTRPQTLARHHTYVDALQATDVECVMGRFKLKPVRCRSCGNTWDRPEEKETDVAIGVRLVADAFKKAFDVAYILSGDSDLAPAIRTIKAEFPEKELVTVSMPGRHPSKELLSLAHRHVRLTPIVVSQCLLPDEVRTSTGVIIKRPTKFDPPVAPGTE